MPDGGGKSVKLSQQRGLAGRPLIYPTAASSPPPRSTLSYNSAAPSNLGGRPACDNSQRAKIRPSRSDLPVHYTFLWTTAEAGFVASLNCLKISYSPDVPIRGPSIRTTNPAPRLNPALSQARATITSMECVPHRLAAGLRKNDEPRRSGPIYQTQFERSHHQFTSPMMNERATSGRRDNLRCASKNSALAIWFR